MNILTSMLLTAPVLMEEAGGSTIDWAASLITPMTTAITPTMLLTVCGLGIAAAVPFAFMHWGKDTLVGQFNKAFRRGKISGK